MSRAEVSPLRCREQSAPTAAPPPCVRSKSAPAELQLPPDHPPAQPALGCIKRRYAFFVGLAVGVLAPVSSVSYIWRAELSAGVSLGVGHVTNLTNRTFGDLANITWPSESYEQMVRLMPQRTWLAKLTSTPRGLRWVRRRYAYQPPALGTYRTHRAACPRAPRTVRTGYAYQPQALGTYSVLWQPRSSKEMPGPGAAHCPEYHATILHKKVRSTAGAPRQCVGGSQSA